MDFKDLMNKHHKSKAYVLGKGPSLDGWERPADGIVIGINNVATMHDCDYSITTDGYLVDLGSPRVAKLVGIPHRTTHESMEKNSTECRGDDIWFMHLNDIRRDGYPCRFPRDVVANTRWLYTCSSSAQPAVHLAWYLGCEELEMVGIDGGGGYAEGFTTEWMEEDKQYAFSLQDTLRVANFAFGKRWSRRVLT